MSEDDDLAFAVFLQERFNDENERESESTNHQVSKLPTSIVDDAWELIDPNPDIRQMFLQFNDEYFCGQLSGIEVKWSPRMTLCAGLCCYEGRGGLCSVRLSQPLLKLRPRKDLVQTLLHEMIHAVLFVTQNNKDHDGHGPEFHKHMNRINKQTGANITVFHSFHDEVNVYRQHWWKCNGPCQKWPPYYGVVKRAMNRAPAPRDTWWAAHKTKCGGTFNKVKEPENYGKKKSKEKEKVEGSKAKDGCIDLSKEKGHVLGSKGTPNLLTLFDRIAKGKTEKKKELDGIAGPSNNLESNETPSLAVMFDRSNQGNTKGKEKESRPAETSTVTKSEVDVHKTKQNTNVRTRELDDENDIENKAKRRKTEGTNNISPVLIFSGAGHVLGTGKNKSGKLPWRKDENLDGSERGVPQTGQLIGPTKTGNICMPRDKSKNLGSQKPSVLTIEDAFKRGKEGSKLSTSTPLGSRIKPIDLSDLPALPQSTSSNVACPVCLVLMSATQVNSHLDSCLLST